MSFANQQIVFDMFKYYYEDSDFTFDDFSFVSEDKKITQATIENIFTMERDYKLSMEKIKSLFD